MSLLTDEQWLMIMLKSMPDAGKTHFTSYFPTPILYVDFDHKLHPVEKTFKQRSMSIDDSSLVQRRAFNRNDILKFKNFIDELMGNRGSDYGTIVFDSLTTIASSALLYFSKMNPINKTTKAGGEQGKVIGGIRVPAFDEFNGESGLLQDLLECIKNLDCHRILTAHIMPGDKPEWVRQIVTAGKKPAAMIPAFFPEIYHLVREPAIDITQPDSFKFYTKTNVSDFARTTLDIDPVVDWTDNNPFEILCEAAQKTGRILNRTR